MKNMPNILFLFADDQRFDTIAALGNEDIHTPHIDELVRSGTSFTHAHIPGGTCGAVCMPSRAMLHSGKTLFHLEKHGASIPSGHVLLGEVLQQAGYRTFGTGKWHNGTSSYARSFTDGGEIFFGGMADHWNVPACSYDPTGKYDKKAKQIRCAFVNNKVTVNICDHIHPGKHSTELFCRSAADWLDQYREDDPFFMYISFMAPHDPRSMPDRFLNMYDPEKIRLPANYMEEHPFHYGEQRERDELLAAYPRTENEIRRHIREYYGMISHLDDEIGNVLDALKRSGKYEETIIVFAADNGLALGQHGLMGKQNNYEHSVRVPLILTGPGIPTNEIRDSYVYLLDIFPTLCDMIGIDIPETVEGISFMPSIHHPGIPARETLYFAFTDKIRAVKDRKYKLIEYRYGGSEWTQLFDLEEDPMEMNNLFGRQEYSSVIMDLRNKLLEYKEAWGDEAHPVGRNYWNA